ncbi:MAG TPA: hypothetical protein VMB50_13605 [Myxococcales bacterium]|nr:hypothetical protein [Myxococcales bacterium]
MSPLLLALLVAAAQPPPPKPVALPAARGLPLLGSPSFTPDGRSVLVVRSAASGDARLYLLPLSHPGREQALDTEAGVVPTRAALSHDGKRLAWLAAGELWVGPAPGGDAGDPVRLYPPKSGDAPLGVKLSHFVWSPDDAWLLIQSPDGWGRVAADTGEVTPFGAHAIDLTGGSIVLGGDGLHAAFVRPTSGPGWINGAKVIGLNLATGQAQVADFDNDYTELLALSDSQLAGMDASGNLWVLRGKKRVLWFQPPAAGAHATVGDYALSLDGSRIAYVVSFASGAPSQLWVGAAPRPPPWPKRE